MTFDRTSLTLVSLITLSACSGDTRVHLALRSAGWGGPVGNSYVFGLDSRNVHGGKAAGYIASVGSNPRGFASPTQSFRADDAV
jgi:hypothetical protein